MAELRRCISTVVIPFVCITVALLSFCYFDPLVVSTCIATVLEVCTSFKLWLTPPVLFLLMNAVVFTLAFTSGVIRVQRPSGRKQVDAELEHDAENDDCKEGFVGHEGDAFMDDKVVDPNYPAEVLSSIFGDGTTHVTRSRKPIFKRSVMSSSPPLEERCGPSYPTTTMSLSERQLHTGPNLKGMSKLQLPSTDQHVFMNMAAVPARNGHGEDKDVDRRADAFIGDFYKKMKLQQADPYIERLERSYGS